MTMLYLLISILAITILFSLINKYQGHPIVCPICAATALVWLAGLIALYFRLFQVNILFLAVLISISLGASIQKYGPKFGLWWKVFMVILGAPGVYYLIQKDLFKAFYLLISLLFITMMFVLKFTAKSAKGQQGDVLKNCCD